MDIALLSSTMISTSGLTCENASSMCKPMCTCIMHLGVQCMHCAELSFCHTATMIQGVATSSVHLCSHINVQGNGWS